MMSASWQHKSFLFFFFYLSFLKTTNQILITKQKYLCTLCQGTQVSSPQEHPKINKQEFGKGCGSKGFREPAPHSTGLDQEGKKKKIGECTTGQIPMEKEFIKSIACQRRDSNTPSNQDRGKFGHRRQGDSRHPASTSELHRRD